jgi:type IV pilus assembly protein PilX
MSARQVPHIPATEKQRGAALAVALILLVVMTLLGLSSVRSVAQQGKMASHVVDRSLYYQFAEAALREGEAQAQIQALAANNSFPTTQYVSNGVCTPGALNDCANGLCATPDPDCPPRWEDAGFNGWFQYNGLAAVQSQAGNALVGTAASGIPAYFVEILRPVGTAVCPTAAGTPNFNMDCNQKYRAPDNNAPCTTAATPGPGEQLCNYLRYRITARVQMPGRSTVVVQSVFSVEPQ